MRKLLKDCLYILFIVTILFFLSDQPSFSKSLKFVQLSDIHYSLVREDTSYNLLSKTRPLLEDAINQINAKQNIDFVMITGDGIDRPNKDSLYSLTKELNTLKYKWYYTLGNHDVNPNGELTKTEFINILKRENSILTFNLPYYTFVPQKGFRAIVLDATQNNKISPTGYIPEEQILWLDTILEKSKRETVLIFIHYPVLPPYDSKNHEITNSNELKTILKKYKMPIAIFSGHYHAAKIIRRDNILHVSTPALAGYPNAFRTVKITKRLNKTIFDFEFCETNLKDLQQKTKILTFGGAIYYGKERDRNTVITIEKK